MGLELFAYKYWDRILDWDGVCSDEAFSGVFVNQLSSLPCHTSSHCSYPLLWVILTQLMKVPIFIFLGPFICRSSATANNLVRVIQTLRCTCLLTSWSGDQAVKTTNKSWHRTLFVFSLILISYSSIPLYAADQKSRPNIIQVFFVNFSEDTPGWLSIFHLNPLHWYLAEAPSSQDLPARGASVQNQYLSRLVNLLARTRPSKWSWELNPAGRG